jgi:xanthine dehydrogenase molybdopterin-binding subunit B
MKNTFIGTPMERREDLRFLRGRGEYVDDVQMPGVVYAVMLRNAVGHGRIVGIDITEALGMPGIHAILTAEDLPGGSVIIPTRVMPLPEFKPFEQPVLAREKVRYVGEPIAMVLADSIALGEDALSAITVDIEQLPPVADWTDAQENSNPRRPTSHWCLRLPRAMRTLRLRGLLISGKSGLRPAVTTAIQWKHAALWPFGTMKRKDSGFMELRKCRFLTGVYFRA